MGPFLHIQTCKSGVDRVNCRMSSAEIGARPEGVVVAIGVAQQEPAG